MISSSQPHPAPVLSADKVTRRAHGLEIGILALILAAAGWFFFWTATSAGSPYTWERQGSDLYNRLADGFLSGRTSFLEAPPPELAKLANPYDPAQNAPYVRYHDVTYFHGRYYLYFGPAPVLLLLAPWKALTGASLPQNLAVVAFAWGAAFLSILVLGRVREKYFPRLSSGLLIAAAVLVTFGTLWPVLLRRPLHYELAIASAAFCGVAALYCLLRADNGRCPVWLALAGVALGLAVAGRPDYLFGAAAVMAGLGWAWWRAENEPYILVRSRRILRPVLCLGLPFFGVMLLLASYNFARFGSFGEFGTSYMLAGSNQQGVSQLAFRYVPINLYYHLVALPNLGAYFPFVLVTGFPWFDPPTGYSGQENMYGWLATQPALWTLIPLWRASKSGNAAQPWRAWALSVTLFAAGNFVFLCLLMGTANRYQLDYVPLLGVLAALAWWQLDTSFGGWRRILLRTGGVVTLALTVGFNVLVSLQHNDLLRYHNPETYARLARVANEWTDPITHATARSGPLRIELMLPKDRPGKLEPLVVTGVSFRADFLYVFYKDERHLLLGFEHTSYGGPKSAPIAIDYDAPHVLEIEMGSLHPPREHPCWRAIAPAEVERRKRTLRVRLDGAVVLEGQYDFYDASPGQVAVGFNPVSDAFGRKFTGELRSVRRGPSGF